MNRETWDQLIGTAGIVLAIMPEEQAEIGDYAEQQVVNGDQAEAYSRYIQDPLAEVNGGATYSETSAAASRRGSTPTRRQSCRARPTRCSRARPCGRSSSTRAGGGPRRR